MIKRERNEHIMCILQDTRAYTQLAGLYASGDYDLLQDYAKANELYHQAGELRCGLAYYNLAVAYEEGRGVEINEKKAEHYDELAAMNGSVMARHNLGVDAKKLVMQILT